MGTATTSPYSVAWTNPAGGSYALTSAATDNVGHVTTSSAVNVSVTNGALDTPTSSPAPSIFAANQNVTLIGPSGATIRYTTDGSTPAASSSIYSGALSLNATNTIKAIAFETDWSPSAVMSATYQIDSTGPTITVSKLPAPNAAGWNHGPVTVSFTCTDALTGVQRCPEPVVFDQEGTNQQVTVHAQDSVGNDTASTVTINIDKTGPSVTLSAPANPTTTTNASVSVTASVGDALSGAASATCNGAMATISSGSVSCTANLRPGVNLVMMQLTDGAGNSASASALVTRTAVASALTVVPGMRGMTVGETVTLRALEDSGVAAENATWTSGDTNVATVASDGTLTAVAAGNATITATQNGLSSQASVTVATSALAVGATRWAIDPFPGVSGTQLVGVSGIDGTSLASIESVAGGAFVRGFTTDGEPTWTFIVPLGIGEYVDRVMGDVFGGIVLILNNQDVLVRLDPSGSGSWRFHPPNGMEEWAQAPDGTIYFTDQDGVTALDGTTGQVKFTVGAPLSVKGCTGGFPFVPAALGFNGLKIDAAGRANVVAVTRWWDSCYYADDAINAIIDVTLYRISGSGTSETVAVNHHEYTVNDLITPHSWDVYVTGNTMPGDDGGTLVWWTPGYWSNLPLGRAAYVDHSGAVSTDYALDRPPAVSASGQIGYVNVRATFGPYDSETIAVQKMNMATGSVLWTVASSGGFASAALDDGGLFVSGTQSMKLAADGSVTSLGGRDNGLAAAMLGTVRIVSSGDSSQVLATVSDMSYASPSGYSLVRGNEGQRGAVRRPTFVYFCPNDLLSTVPPITCGDYAVSVRNQVRTGQLKTEPPRIYSVSAATADRFKTEVTEGSGDAIAFIGHGIFVQPYGAVGLEFADKDLVKPGFSGHHESNQIRVTTPLIPHAKVVFIAACEIAETFMSLWDISDTTTGRALIVAVGPSGDVDLHDASLAWDRIAVALADGSTVTQAKDVANAWLAGIGNALRFQVAGDGNVKVK